MTLLKLPPYLRGAAYQHALECFPEEACGLVVSGDDGLLAYVRSANLKPDGERENAFRLDPSLFEKHREDHSLVAVVHSHTRGQNAPSKSDMIGQRQSGVPWIIVVLDGNGPDEKPRILEEFGFPLPLDRPLKGVPFRPGVADCVETIAAWYYQKRGVTIWTAPRDDAWWFDEDGGAGEDLFMEHFAGQGFRRLEPHEIHVDPEDPRSALKLQEGDVGLARVMSPHRINHGVVYTGGQLMMHHLLNRVSSEEPVTRWLPRIEIWLRYEGTPSAQDDPSLRQSEGPVRAADQA